MLGYIIYYRILKKILVDVMCDTKFRVFFQHLISPYLGTVEKKIYKERCGDAGVEFAKLCNHLAQRFPQEKLPKLKDFISGNLLDIKITL